MERGGIVRLTWEQMDALKARMLHEGFPLADSDAARNETIWRSLAGRRRRPQLQALMGWTEDDIEARLRDLRQQRTVQTGRR